MNDAKEYDVFISHSSKDVAIAQQLVDLMESRGIRCWFSPHDISGSYGETITKAVKSIPVLLLLLSENSNQSHNVVNEVDIAHQFKKPIVVVKIGALTLSDALTYYISSRHHYDATERSAKSFEKAIRECERLLQRPVQQEPLLPAQSPPVLKWRYPALIAAGVVLALLIWRFLPMGTPQADINKTCKMSVKNTAVAIYDKVKKENALDNLEPFFNRASALQLYDSTGIMQLIADTAHAACERLIPAYNLNNTCSTALSDSLAWVAAHDLQATGKAVVQLLHLNTELRAIISNSNGKALPDFVSRYKISEDALVYVYYSHALSAPESGKSLAALIGESDQDQYHLLSVKRSATNDIIELNLIKL